MTAEQWICCQLGAREHFAVARAMHRRGAPGGARHGCLGAARQPWAQLPGATGRRLSERYSGDLASAPVRAFTASLIAHEAGWRLRGLTGWPLVIARNRWFQQQAAGAVREVASQRPTPRAVFAHSLRGVGDLS
jgi:hypothetical protein